MVNFFKIFILIGIIQNSHWMLLLARSVCIKIIHSHFSLRIFKIVSIATNLSYQNLFCKNIFFPTYILLTFSYNFFFFLYDTIFYTSLFLKIYNLPFYRWAFTLHYVFEPMLTSFLTKFFGLFFTIII